jgi:hypothetical protein
MTEAPAGTNSDIRPTAQATRGAAPLQPSAAEPVQTGPGMLNTPLEVRALERVYLDGRRRTAGVEPDAPLVGLAFSGGGIRASTFCLGVAQALTNAGLMHRVDYLSTVSGGGFIGSCLSSYLSHPSDESEPTPVSTRRSRPDAMQSASDAPPLAPDLWHEHSRARWGVTRADMPFFQRAPLQHLRVHGDFLILRDMFLSRDVLRVVGIMLTGLLATLGMYMFAMSALAALSLVLIRALGGGQLWTQLATSHAHVDWSAFTNAWLPHRSDWPSFACGALVGACFGVLTWWFNVNQTAFLGASEGETRDDRSEGRQLVFTAIALCFFPFALSLACVLAPWLGKMLSHQLDAVTWLWMPVAFSGGVLGSATALYAALLPRMSRVWDLRHRSRLGAVGALGLYGVLLFSGVACLPVLIWGVSAHHAVTTPSLTALGSLVATRLFARPPERGGSVQRSQLQAAAIQIALSILVPVVLVATLVSLASLWLVMTNFYGAIVVPYCICGASALMVGVLGYFVDYNSVSPHYFYRDRLAEGFLRTEEREAGMLTLTRDDEQLLLAHMHGRRRAEQTRDERALERTLCEAAAQVVTFDREPENPYKRAAIERAQQAYGLVHNAAPYHLIVGALNLAGSNDLARRNRKSDHFIFSRLFCGSATTGYEFTDLYESGQLELARAMTISGAAAASAAGAYTSSLQAFAATLFNARLGYWMPKPRQRRAADGLEAIVDKATTRGIAFWPYYLLLEMFGQTTAQGRMVNLSDGGHTGDNPALCPLLQRRCDLIIVCDAGRDPFGTCDDLAASARIAYVDENVVVDIDSVGFARRSEGTQPPGHVLGTVHYPRVEATGDRDASPKRAAVLYLKSGLPSGELPLAVRAYAATHPEFPHESTADQFFDDAQFEAYRSLGEALTARMIEALRGSAQLPAAVESWLGRSATVLVEVSVPAQAQAAG